MVGVAEQMPIAIAPKNARVQRRGSANAKQTANQKLNPKMEI
jgi:hypothetical protein